MRAKWQIFVGAALVAALWSAPALAQDFTVNPITANLTLFNQGERNDQLMIESGRLNNRDLINLLTGSAPDNRPPPEWILVAFFPCQEIFFEGFFVGVWDREDQEIVGQVLDFDTETFQLQTRRGDPKQSAQLAILEEQEALIFATSRTQYSRLPPNLRDGSDDDRLCVSSYRTEEVTGWIEGFGPVGEGNGFDFADIGIRSGSFRAGRAIDIFED